MNSLNECWQPNFGTVYTWFAMDKNGLIAMMFNNSWGDIPKSILKINDAELLLDDLNEFTYEESESYSEYPSQKDGETLLDLYSGLMYRTYKCKKDVEEFIYQSSYNEDEMSDWTVPSKKGYFIYEAVEGSKEGEDFPVGYDGFTKMGDYFRHLMPTVYGSISDFPKELWHGIAVSNTLDFTKDRVLDNNKINEYFPKNYTPKEPVNLAQN